MRLVATYIFGLAALVGLTTVPASAVTYYQNYTVNFASNSSGYETTPDGVAIGPYTSTIVAGSTTQNLQLFCDDLETSVNWGQSYPAKVTNVASVDATTARFYANPTTNSNVLASIVPTGTNLYQQLAWLADHLRTIGTNGNGTTGTSGTSCGADTNCQNEARASIQEALWNLTIPTNVTGMSHPASWSTNANFYFSKSDDGEDNSGSSSAKQTSLTTTGASNAGTRNISDTVLSWENAARTYASTDTSVDYTKWFVVNNGGAAGSNGAVQELLAYNFTPVANSTPEPGSLVLLGSALLTGGLVVRRRRKAKQTI